jgi:hypothetical protein
MSSITILGGDFEILFDDEKNQNGGTTAVAGMRTIRRASGASETVYTTNQLYSAVACYGFQESHASRYAERLHDGK